MRTLVGLVLLGTSFLLGKETEKQGSFKGAIDSLKEKVTVYFSKKEESVSSSDEELKSE